MLTSVCKALCSSPITQSDKHIARLTKINRGICDSHLEERKKECWGGGGKSARGRGEEEGGKEKTEGKRCLLVEEMTPERTCVQEGKKIEKKKTKTKIK